MQSSLDFLVLHRVMPWKYPLALWSTQDRAHLVSTHYRGTFPCANWSKVTGKLENVSKIKLGLGAETEPGNKTKKSLEQQEIDSVFKNVSWISINSPLLF
jgi:hypothetical protein